VSPSANKGTAGEPSSPRTAAWLPQLIHRPNMVECFDDTVGLPWAAGHTLPLAPVSLELQNLCAFRAYSELRLGSSELGGAQLVSLRTSAGQLLHASLQVLWRQLRDSETLAGHTTVT